MTLAVVGGNGLRGSRFGADAPELTVDDGTHAVVVRDLGDAYFLQRHGFGGSAPAHLVDHVANLKALVALGCDRVLALNSSASLHDRFAPGSFLLADDRGLRAPEFEPAWRTRVLDAWHATTDVPLHDGVVYWQAIGPRLPTASEIRLFAHHADVVGMTMASECVVAGELGLTYASVCVVDTFATGVGEHPLAGPAFEIGRAATQQPLEKVLAALVPVLAA
jgi:5'-methylthioadenosine phosphorylase